MKRWAAESAPLTDVDLRYHEANEKNFIRDFGDFDLLALNPADFPASAQLTMSFLTSATTPTLERRIAELYVDYCRLSYRWRATEREFAGVASKQEEDFPTSAIRISNRRLYDISCAQLQSLKLRKLDLRTSTLTLHSTIVLLLQVLSFRMCPSKPTAAAAPAPSSEQPASNTAEVRRSLPSFDIEIDFAV